MKTYTYLEWLMYDYGIPRTYSIFARTALETPFKVVVDSDDSRVLDGLALRDTYKYTCRRQPSLPPAVRETASFLEVMGGLAERMVFGWDLTNEGAFWVLMENSFLDKCSDNVPRVKKQAKEMMDFVCGRGYRKDGVGGFFPLAGPPCDQRITNLWYQMQYYMQEHYSE